MLWETLKCPFPFHKQHCTIICEWDCSLHNLDKSTSLKLRFGQNSYKLSYQIREIHEIITEITKLSRKYSKERIFCEKSTIVTSFLWQALHRMKFQKFYNLNHRKYNIIIIIVFTMHQFEDFFSRRKTKRNPGASPTILGRLRTNDIECN